MESLLYHNPNKKIIINNIYNQISGDLIKLCDIIYKLCN